MQNLVTVGFWMNHIDDILVDKKIKNITLIFVFRADFAFIFHFFDTLFIDDIELFVTFNIVILLSDL